MCAELGQRIELSTPYAPWQDGKVERSIRTIIEKVTKTMIAMEIPAYLWPEIFLACIHINNRTVSSTLKGKTPIKAFLDQVDPNFHLYQHHKPSIAHVRILGCKSYVLIPEGKRVHTEKLNPRAELGILVGYDGEKIYKIWIPSRKGNKLIRSSNVRFDEMVNSVSHYQNRGDISSNSDDENEFVDQDYFDNVSQSIGINKSNHSTHEINEDDSETDDPIGEIKDSHSIHSESTVHESHDAGNLQVQDAENSHRQDDEDINTVEAVPKRYNNRGSKAKPSTKQSENECFQSSKAQNMAHIQLS